MELEETTKVPMNPLDRTIQDAKAAGVINTEPNRSYSTGAVRSDDASKPRPDLISPQFLLAWGQMLADKAQVYEERNWEKGIPLSRHLASAFRHMLKLLSGDTDEDHAIFVASNMMMFWDTRRRIQGGLLPDALDDLPGTALANLDSICSIQEERG